MRKHYTPSLAEGLFLIGFVFLPISAGFWFLVRNLGGL